MADPNVIKPKARRSAPGAPAVSTLQDREIAVNVPERTIYMRVGEAVVAVSNYTDPAAAGPGVNPAAHGAVMDGVADDTAALNAALAEARANGGYLLIPRNSTAGTFGLVLESGDVIRGEDKYSSKIKLLDAAPHISHVVQNADMQTGNAGIVIENVWLDGNRDAHPRTHHTTVAQFQRVTGLSFRNVRISGGMIEGIYAYLCPGVEVLDVEAFENGHP